MKKTFIMLGRTGDILNILPALEYENKDGGYKPRLIVSKDYADILEGIDYVEGVIYNNDFRKIILAIEQAKREYPEDKIINCAVYGENYIYKKECASFLREAWRLSETPVAFSSLSLHFTKRCKDREADLLNYFVGKDKKPFILTALNGISSPFPYKNLLLKKLKEQLNRDFRIIDISDYRAKYIFDLLILYENAHCLIAIDSAPLHLANAVEKLPVVSLISDLKDKWHQSDWKKNHILRVLYSEVPNRINDIIEASAKGFNYERPLIRLIASNKVSLDSDTIRRNEMALASWYKERIISGHGRWQFDIHRSDNIPKVKQLIDQVSNKCSKKDIILITNTDILFIPGITGWILHEVERDKSVYFHRHDFQRIDKHLISESEIKKGKWYCGSDAFAFTKQWWEENKDLYPDMYYAREYWDMIMRNLIKRSGGAEIHNAIYHEKHKSFWETNRNNEENLINRSLAKNWIDTFGGDWLDWKYPINKIMEKYKYV